MEATELKVCPPWDSPGKNTGVGCHFLLQRMKVKSESEVAQSCPILRDPMDCSLPGFSVHGPLSALVPLARALLHALGDCRGDDKEGSSRFSPAWISDKFVMSHSPKTRFAALALARSPSPSQLSPPCHQQRLAAWKTL